MFKKVLLASLMAMGIQASALAATEGVDYEILPIAIEPVQKDKVEVTEFFSYSCIHCRNLDPVLLKHMKSQPSDVAFRAEHVVWDGEGYLGLARLAAAVNETNSKYAANPAIWNAIFEEKINLGDPAVATKWLSEQTSFDGKKVLGAFNSFSNQTQAKQMGDLTAKYEITGTPTLVVGEKYRVLFPNGYEQGMKTLDELVAKVRQERGMKAPAPKAVAPKSKGTVLIKSSL